MYCTVLRSTIKGTPTLSSASTSPVLYRAQDVRHSGRERGEPEGKRGAREESERGRVVMISQHIPLDADLRSSNSVVALLEVDTNVYSYGTWAVWTAGSLLAYLALNH